MQSLELASSLSFRRWTEEAQQPTQDEEVESNGLVSQATKHDNDNGSASNRERPPSPPRTMTTTTTWLDAVSSPHRQRRQRRTLSWSSSSASSHSESNNDQHDTLLNGSDSNSSSSCFNGQRRQQDQSRRQQRRRRPREQLPTKVVAGRYVAYASLALLLTLTCPGNTLLWRRWQHHHIDQNEEVQLNTVWLSALLIVFALTLGTFFALLGSDPGYLTMEVMQRFACHEEAEQETKQQHQVRQQQWRNEAVNGCAALEFSSTSDKHLDVNCKEWNSQQNRNEESAISQDDQQLQQPTATRTRTETSSIATSHTSSSSGSVYTHTRRKMCSHCHLAPPLRAHHCRICRQCVATFDHHCDFIGTCIGERNHCRFWCFLFFQWLGFVLFCHTVGSSLLGWSQFLQHHNNNSAYNTAALGAALRVVLAKIYLYPLMVLATIMLIVHTFLALTNSLTFEMGKSHHLEYMKGVEMCDLPYSSPRLHRNIALFCCQRDDAWNRLVLCITSRSIRPWLWCRKDHEQERLDHEQECMVEAREWTPILWKPPGRIIRDSEDWWNHPWRNKYWSCC